jgi:Tfp pilus assembly protein PilF
MQQTHRKGALQLVVWALWGTLAAAGLVHAAPYLPSDPQQVLETLPLRFDPALSELARLRAQWQRQPGDAVSAAALVRASVDAARRNGDPRFLGQAEAVLVRFGAAAPLPPELRELHAMILQSLHQFDAAVTELSAVLALEPNRPQALLTRATVLLVRGRPAEARSDCSRLWRAAGQTTAALCLASVAAVTGGERSAAVLLEHTLVELPAKERPLRTWALTLRAEIAVRQGDAATAGGYFQQALDSDPADRYARAAYADFLLDDRRPEAARALTADYSRDDNLLLRHALALQALGAGSAAGNPAAGGQQALRADLAALLERHAAARLRGDRTHLREEARLRLELLHDPRNALALARENWSIQHEPEDARILLLAARSAGDAAASEQIQAWVRASDLHDVRLQAPAPPARAATL